MPRYTILPIHLIVPACALILMAGAPGGTAAARDYCMDPSSSVPSYYMQPAEVDLTTILGPPPRPGSPADQADLGAVLDAQRTRTPAQVESARDDSCLSIFRFADVMGPGFRPANLPFTATFIERVFHDDQNAVAAAKKYFRRARPFVAHHQVSPVIAQPASHSYPSGHATFAYVAAILLADMVPEKSAPIFARAARYAHSRVVGGVHYPSDVEAGRISGSVIDNVLLHNRRFATDLARARDEVRRAVGCQ